MCACMCVCVRETENGLIARTSANEDAHQPRNSAHQLTTTAQQPTATSSKPVDSLLLLFVCVWVMGFFRVSMCRDESDGERETHTHTHTHALPPSLSLPLSFPHLRWCQRLSIYFEARQRLAMFGVVFVKEKQKLDKKMRQAASRAEKNRKRSKLSCTVTHKVHKKQRERRKINDRCRQER